MIWLLSLVGVSTAAILTLGIAGIYFVIGPPARGNPRAKRAHIVAVAIGFFVICLWIFNHLLAPAVADWLLPVGLWILNGGLGFMIFYLFNPPPDRRQHPRAWTGQKFGPGLRFPSDERGR